MELHYNITKQDFIDFNLDYCNKNAVMQRSLTLTRISIAVIVLVGGTMLMYFLKSLTPVSVALYGVLAIVCFFGFPWYYRRKLIKNVDRILQSANNKQLCGEKTFILRDDGFELLGENEHSEYKYDAVERTSTDDNHYYIFVDEFSALIVPFSAFRDEEQKKEFYSRITANIADEALKC